MFTCLKENCEHSGPHIHCSSLSRPMNCAGSLFFKDLQPEPTNDAAKEGTACGELLQWMLLGQPMKTHASNGVPIDDDMRFFAGKAYAEITSQTHSPVACEQHIDWQTKSGIWIRGRYDAAYVSEGVLCIDDLKYGFNLVEAKENWQLIGYAIGEVIRLGIPFEKIRLRIIQPRAHHEDGPIREWFLTYSELLEYKETIEARMIRIANGFKDLHTGSQCKYCPGAIVCPAHNKAYHRGIDIAHTFLQDNIPDDELSFQIETAHRVQELIKTRVSSMEALAVNRIKSGKIIKKFGIEKRYGHRKWKSNVTPDLVKMLTGKSIAKTEILSPAQAEKIGLDEDFLNMTTEKPFLGVKLKPVDANKIGDKIFGNPNK